MKYLILVFIMAISFATFSSFDTSFAQGPPADCTELPKGPYCGPPKTEICHEICADSYFNCVDGDELIANCLDDLMNCNNSCQECGETFCL
jgi:hypothetical protein